MRIGSNCMEILPYKVVKIDTTKPGIQIIRDLITSKLLTKYKLAQEMKVTQNTAQNWAKGIGFNEKKRRQDLLALVRRLKGLQIIIV